MSASKKDPVDVTKVADQNPGVDAAQVQEAQELIQELSKRGARRRSYEISSPYVRRPFRKGSSRFGTPYA